MATEKGTLTHEELVAKQRKWKEILDDVLRALVVVVVIAGLITVFGTVMTLNEVQKLSETNVKLNNITVENSKLLVDCTTPGYQCYERSRGESGKAVVILNNATKAAVICADQQGAITTAEMETCIKSEVAKIQKIQDGK